MTSVTDNHQRRVATPRPATSDVVSLEFPPKAQFVALARLALTGVCRTHGFADDDIADLKLAITEACSNSIRHAYSDVQIDSETVDVTYAVAGDRLTIEVSDRGRGFDWTGPTEDEMPEGGLGISIIQAVCDEFEVRRPGDGQGATLVLTKLRSAERAAS